MLNILGKNTILKDKMKKLKTLKDIEYRDERQMFAICSSTALKNNAIRWIKELKKVIIYPYGKDIPIVDGSNKLVKLIGAEEWIINFFNITEEDLK